MKALRKHLDIVELPVYAHAKIHHRAVPLLNVGHADLVKGIDYALEGIPLEVCGNFLNGHSLPECVKRSETIVDCIAALP